MMAISRAQLLKELLPGLNELFGTEYEKYDTTWAVYADYCYEDMEWKVSKIEQWRDYKHFKTTPNGNRSLPKGVHKVTDCRDELAAYKKFMEKTNG